MGSSKADKLVATKTVPLLPLDGALLFPRAVLPLHIFESRYVDLVDDALSSNRLIGLIQPQQAEDDNHVPPLQNIGTLGRITHFEEVEDDRYMIGLTGLCRFTLKEDTILHNQLYRTGKIDTSAFKKDLIAGFGENDIDRNRFVNLLRSYAEFADFELDWDEINEAGLEDLINTCSMASPYAARERQALLEADSLATRAEMLMAFAEIEMSRQDANITMQ